MGGLRLLSGAWLISGGIWLTLATQPKPSGVDGFGIRRIIYKGETFMPLEFGIFDHLDDNGIPLADLFETRLSPSSMTGRDSAPITSPSITRHP
jgi:hypothetical protein